MRRILPFTPQVARRFLAPLYWNLQKLVTHHRSIEEVHTFFRKDYLSSRPSQLYSAGKERSRFLVEQVRKYVDLNARILEPGCNVGRNLHYLYEAGFTKLEGIEIGARPLQLMKEVYPELASHAHFYNEAVEDVITRFEDGRFDLVFTMDFLGHLHSESEFVFQELVRITKRFLVVAEDERRVQWYHYPRKYKPIFEDIGMRQIEELAGRKHGVANSHSWHLRVFEKLAYDHKG